jgi:hypothetical protein
MLTPAELSTEWAVALPITTAILGALLAFGWNYYLGRREEARELRAVARILDAELAHAELLMKRARRLEDGAPLDEMSHLRDADWREHRLLLARHLPKDHWHVVQRAYSALDNLRALADELATSPGPRNRDEHPMSWHYPRQDDETVVADARGVIKPYADMSREERDDMLDIIRYAVAPHSQPIKRSSRSGES